MIYVCSDIHGFYSEYLGAVSLLGNDDKLYIIGDILDRGSAGIKIIRDIIKRDNVTLVKGNHELMMLEIFENILFSFGNTNEIQNIINEELVISQIGQEQTLIDFSKLERREQSEIINFIKSLPLYEEVKVNGRSYILVHAGLPDFDGLPIEYYEESELLFGPHDYNEIHYEDTTIICGHLPTRFIDGATPDVIYRGADTINVDCGLGFGGQLGVLCLDTDEEIYF